jgi:hypothetical protein
VHLLSTYPSKLADAGRHGCSAVVTEQRNLVQGVPRKKGREFAAFLIRCEMAPELSPDRLKLQSESLVNRRMKRSRSRFRRSDQRK